MKQDIDLKHYNDKTKDAPESGFGAEGVPAPKSTGEICFDTGTYGIIGGVVTFLIGMKAGFSARYGKLAPALSRCTQWLQKSGFKPDTAENLVMTTALMTGGNATIPVIRAAEHYRVPIINKINEYANHAPVEENTQVKQSWASLIKGRVLAWTMVFAAFKGVVATGGSEKLEKFEHDFAKNVVCKPLGKPTHLHGQETKLYRYGRIAALDVFATIAATTLLYFSSRFFAGEPKEQKAALAPAPVNASAPEEPGSKNTTRIKRNILSEFKPATSHTALADASASNHAGLSVI